MSLQDAFDVAIQPRCERAPRDTAALIAYILERFHAVHRCELRELYKLARKIETAYAEHPNCPAGLADFLAALLGELEHHMMREEEVLFPVLLAGGGGCTPFAIRRMRAEHDDHGEQLAALRRLTDDFKPPTGACLTWQALYAGCCKLHDDLIEHIRLENDLLFPQFE